MISSPITFEDVKEKFEKADRYMALNTGLALNNDFPAHATWINPPTLARWFYGSSKEWLSDYLSTANQLKELSLSQQSLMINWESCLKGRLELMNANLKQKYSDNSLLMEALKQ
jgi:hypothetical protein